MTVSQECKRFAKMHGLSHNATGGVPMVSRFRKDGSMWAECFDNWTECHAFLKQVQVARETTGARYPWMD